MAAKSDALLLERLELHKGRSPRFGERLGHFMTLSDPRSVFASERALEDAVALLRSDKRTYARAGERERRRAKRLYLSAYNPRTGRKQQVVGRMAFQPWGNTVATASMLIFSKTALQVAVMQVVNQAFNASVNAINSAKRAEGSKLLRSFATATSAAAMIGIGLKYGTRGPAFAKLQPFIPFAAVSAGQAVNVPLMRSEELEEGMQVSEERKGKKKPVGYSRAAARKALTEVWATRVIMAIPPMVSVPIVMDAIANNTSLLATSGPQATIALTSLLVGLNLCFSTPLALAAFPQEGSIKATKLEPALRARVQSTSVTYDKGL